MAHDPKQIEQLARTYTEAWCSRDPARVAGHYVPGGMIAINGGDVAEIGEVAEGFIAAFPDIAAGRPGALRVEAAPFLRSVWLDDASGLGWARSLDDLLASAGDVPAE